ncbi:hypothetical protein I302_108411 [Kwoniella bestiolae CBS 10118]|uniref:Uncharacterized protein n=1 Tax=Kwoniella bestiolae CBS 10118 TaxID=1296100 RepID=A0A1B9FVR3_9TREE|nr:hypothetical protein I302_07214 [Kwoniella bestiolae CBS 10118]OCF22867.1 hypothetical protein I302_07214 [Kwoniella bestiolae CBS 10118]
MSERGFDAELAEFNRDRDLGANCLGDIASRYNGHINRMNANTKCLGLKTQSAQELLNEMVRRERDSISNSYILKWWESDPDSKREWGDASFEEAVSTFKKKRT